MTFDPRTGTVTLPPVRSDSEENNVPNRSMTVTQSVIDGIGVNVPQQGTPLLTSAPVIAGVGPIQFYTGR